MKTGNIALAICMAAWMPLASGQPEAPVATGQTQPKSMTAKTGLWSAYDAIGANIVDANNQNLAEINDIVLDQDQNRIAYVIVSYGGLLGLGDKHFAVPWQAFSQRNDGAFVLQVDPEKLKNAPGFEKGTLPGSADPLFHENVHSFYGVDPYEVNSTERSNTGDNAAPEPGREPAAAEPRGEDPSNPVVAFDWTAWSRRGSNTDWARRLSELIGINIENNRQDSIAEVEDVIIDGREARVAYAVVSYGGTLGFFSDTAIIPWNALRLDLERGVYMTDATEEQLDQAKLNAEEYRNLEDRNFSEALYRNFKTMPYWEEYGYGAPTQGNATAEENKGATKTDKNGKAHAGDSNRISGTVISVGNYAGDTPESGGKRLRIRTSGGEVRTVHLPAGDAMTREDVKLSRGDEVVITGSDQDYRGHKVFRAQAVEKDGKTVKLDQ